MNLSPADLSAYPGLPGRMASYAASEQKLASALKDLHDYLWGGTKPREDELLRRLVRGAKDLDRHLGTHGRVERAVRPLTRKFRKAPQGADLFTFLQAVAGLSYAADRVRRNSKEAAKAASELGVSLTIHLASSSGGDSLIDAFESGRQDFDEFSAGLQDVLESRGVLRAAEFTRAANLAFDVHALWNRRASPATKRIMATAGVVSAGFACVVFVDALRALGRFRQTPYAKLVPLVAAILQDLGGQP